MQAANVFNGYICAHLCYHLAKTGIFDLFNDHHSTDLNSTELNSTDLNSTDLSFISTNAINLPDSLSDRNITQIKSLISNGIKFGVFTHNSDSNLELTTFGIEIKKNLGFFIWAVGGYGHFLRNFTDIDQQNVDLFHTMIDGGNVALGSRLASREFMWDIIIAELRQLDLHRIVDLGCGAAGALMDICHTFSKVSGIGIDINAKAIKDANFNIIQRELQDRVSVCNQNVLQAVNDPLLKQQFLQVDTVMSFMMVHDLFNLQDPIWVLRKLRSTFPNAKHFVIADTFASSSEQTLNHSSPIFEYGFEYIHHLMNIKLFQKTDYEHYFNQAGFKISKTRYLNVANTYLFLLE